MNSQVNTFETFKCMRLEVMCEILRLINHTDQIVTVWGGMSGTGILLRLYFLMVMQTAAAIVTVK